MGCLAEPEPEPEPCIFIYIYIYIYYMGGYFDIENHKKNRNFEIRILINLHIDIPYIPFKGPL